MLDLIHKQHKYIAKTKSNGKTRYFYTQEELAAYKRALSSRDEKNKFIKVTGADKAKSPLEGFKVNQLGTARVRTAYAKYYMDNKKDNPSEVAKAKADYEKFKPAEDDYDRARTLKGKAEDVKKVNAQVKERRAEEKAVRKEEKAAKKADRKEEIKDYAKALTYKDEEKALEKAEKKRDAAESKYEDAMANRKKVVSENQKDSRSLNKEKRKNAQAKMDEARSYEAKMKSEFEKLDDEEWEASMKYLNSNRKEDLKEAFNKHHPDTVKRVNKAKKKIKKYLGN